MNANVDKQSQFTSIAGLFVRLICLVFVFVFCDTFFQYQYLIGENGYSPVGEFLKSTYTQSGMFSFFKFPGLFWLSSSDPFIGIVLIIGTLVSLLAALGIYVALNIGIALICWLSFINSGSDFFIYIWDTFLLEAGIIALIVTLLGRHQNYLRFTHFLLLLLMFRLWFSMGFVTVAYNQSVKVSGNFMTYFFQNQPMPTNAAFYFYHLPPAVHQLMSGILLFIELIVPFFIFFKRLRTTAFVLFFSFSVLVQLVGNFAWFNLLTIIVCLPLLIDSKPGEKLSALHEKLNLRRIDPAFKINIKAVFGFAVFQVSLQFLMLIFLFFPIGNRYLNFLNYYNYQPGFETWKQKNVFTKLIALPLDLGSGFKLANPYGVFKGIAVKRWEIEFGLCNDTTSGTVQKIVYYYKAGLSNNNSFYAPHFPRLEQQLFYESQQGSFYRHYTPFNNLKSDNCWTKRLLRQLKQSGDYTKLQRENDSLKFRFVKITVSDMSFNSKSDYEQTGKMWLKKEVFSFFIEDSSINCPLIPDAYFVKYHKHQS